MLFVDGALIKMKSLAKLLDGGGNSMGLNETLHGIVRISGLIDACASFVEGIGYIHHDACHLSHGRGHDGHHSEVSPGGDIIAFCLQHLRSAFKVDSGERKGDGRAMEFNEKEGDAGFGHGVEQVLDGVGTRIPRGNADYGMGHVAQDTECIDPTFALVEHITCARGCLRSWSSRLIHGNGVSSDFVHNFTNKYSTPLLAVSTVRTYSFSLS